MNKSSHFSGQPIFSQLINLIPRNKIFQIAKKFKSDHYYKKFRTYEHLITMLYAIWSNCSSIREVTAGLLACSGRINHLGMNYFPRRSTLSDANCKRNAQVFEEIYKTLYDQLAKTLPDSRSDKWAKMLYIVDSTTISLFQEILKNAGPTPMNGKRKGGIKAHTLIRADQDVPCLVRLTPAAAHDSPFMKDIDVPGGSVLVFDKGYKDYKQLEHWNNQNIYFVSRLNKAAVYTELENYTLTNDQHQCGLLKDQKVLLGHHYHNNITRIKVRLVVYSDRQSGKVFYFITNLFDLPALTVAELYKKRWQIEILYKRLKQNYPLKYFLGDNENAIRIQIWCALIADLLLKFVRKHAKRNWSFANLASMIRLHLMNYINLFKFLNNPEQAIEQTKYQSVPWSLFPT